MNQHDHSSWDKHIYIQTRQPREPREPRQPRQPRQPREPREPSVLLCIRMHTYECMPVWVFLCLYLCMYAFSEYVIMYDCVCYVMFCYVI